MKIYFSKSRFKKFPVINLKHKVNEHPSSSIIFNAANEVLVDQFLKRKYLMGQLLKDCHILRDRNYKKYAIRKAETLNQITAIDYWARKTIISKIANV